MIPSALAPFVDHLWQSTLGAVVAAAIALALRRNRANVRYRVWLAASVKFLVPLSWLAAAGGLLAPRTVPVLPPATVPVAVRQVFIPASLPDAVTPAAGGAAWLVMAVAVLWAVGVAVVLFSWWRQWRPLRDAVRLATPLRLDLTRAAVNVPVVSSRDLREPGIIGVRRPVLVLPDGIVDRLTRSELDAIVEHELCHVRRRDNLTAAVHMLVEALFWFHPLVWWLEHRLVDERERACDEDVLRAGRDPHVYAAGILNVCRFYVETPIVCSAGISGSNLRRRIEAILAARGAVALRIHQQMLVALVVVVAIGGPVAAGIAFAPRSHAQVRRLEPPTPPVKIEVASIRPNSSDDPGPPFRAQSGGFSATTTARMLMAIAFGVQDSQLVGAPSWVESERFDITAKVEGVTGALPNGMFPAALRDLLETRFGLVARRETREGQIFGLVAGTGQSKLRPATGLRPLQISEQTGFISGTMDLNTLATWLGFRLERTVVNKTGLNGAYDVELTWTPDADQRSSGELRTPPPPPPPPPIPGGIESAPPLPRRTVPLPDPQGPSLFTAIQEQLGLKLEAQRGPVEVVVIEKIERPRPD